MKLLIYDDSVDGFIKGYLTYEYVEQEEATDYSRLPVIRKLILWKVNRFMKSKCRFRRIEYWSTEIAGMNRS